MCTDLITFCFYASSCLNVHELTYFSLFSGLSVAQQQFFRVRPNDVSAGEGTTAVIHCTVGNRAGRVQWTKDGLTLGKKTWLYKNFA